MSYQFDLKGSQLFLLLAGLVLVAALLFLLGMIVGAGTPESRPVETDTGEAPATNGDQLPTGSASAPDTNANAPVAAETPAPRGAVVPPPVNSQSRGRIYELQVGAFLNREATQPVIDELAAGNLRPYVVESRDSRERTLYTVRLGPWESMAEAAEAARAFRQHTEFDAYDPVIRHRPKPMDGDLNH